MMDINLELNKWTCIDADKDIYVTKTDETTFEFSSAERLDDININILAFNIDMIEACINTYGYTLFETSLSKNKELVNIVEEFEGNSRLFIAKCLWECWFDSGNLPF